MKPHGLPILLLLLVAGCAQQPAASGETIKLGFVDALTGDAATYGEVSRNTMQLAVEEINAAGGINGKKLEVVYEDGKCTGKDAATAAQKLLTVDKVEVVLGLSCSGMVLGSAPIFEQHKKILFSSYATNPSISGAGDFVFRNAYSDELIGSSMAEEIGKKFSRVAVLVENTDYAKGVVDVFERGFGGEVVSKEVYNQEARDMRTQLTKIMQAEPEAIIISPQTVVTGAQALKQLHELNYGGPVYTNVVMVGSKLVEIAGEAAEGLNIIADPEPMESAEKKRIFDLYVKRYGEPDYSYPVASNWDAVHIMADAIREVGYDAEKIKGYLYGMPEYNGLLGKYRFDANGDATGLRTTVKQVVDGEFVKIGG